MRKQLTIGLAVFLLILIVLPGLIVHNLRWDPVKDDQLKSSRKIKLLTKSKGIIELPLEEYLIGVVAAEMPAEFAGEALKAQAVAARTYTLKSIQQQNKSKEHPEADMCDNPQHCQAWESYDQLKKKWGPSYSQNLKKIRDAVVATRNQVIFYQGKLIDPVYHASCGGYKTENSEEVWGVYEPYLRSVTCNFDEKIQKEIKVFKIGDFNQKVFNREKNTIKEIRSENTSSGRVKFMIIDHQKISATEIRKRLGLKSTKFTYALLKDRIQFTTIGNGHGVGMCQYGANGMAKIGKNYQQIISYYYIGAKVAKLIKE